MRITADILYGLLDEKYQVSRYGKGVKAKELSLPSLYESGATPVKGSIYVARTGDLPNRPPEGCVFICCGTKPPNAWNMWPCDVIHIVDPHTNLVGVFNVTLGILDKLISWEDTMQRLALSGANVREMVEISIPVFQNTLTVTDYELNILAHCEPNRSLPGSPVTMNDDFDRVPTAFLSAAKRVGFSLLSKREPYVSEEIESLATGVPGIDSYCINLFYGDTYVGTCAIKEEDHLLKPHERELFQMFADYVHDCLGVQSQNTGNQLVSVRTVFEQVLHGYPVSMRDMKQALRLIEFNLGGTSVEQCKWCCTVIQNTHQDRGLPESYLCKLVEELLPATSVFLFDDSIVAISLFDAAKHRQDVICKPLQAFLDDMDFRAGVSRTFLDPFHARTYYQQASNALEMGYELSPERRCCLFGDHVLDYMLASCCGDFDAESIVAPELIRLYKSGPSGPEYVRTLKTFLDNDCHTTQTAEEMFLHRSTLIKRLDRIRETVNLESPDRRLYLRICLHLPDIEEVLEKGVDVGGLD